MLRLRWIALLGCAAGVLLGGGASATVITVGSGTDLGSLAPGAVFTVTVGLDDLDEIQAYTVDVEWSGAGLSLIGAAQLGCTETSPGTCTALGFAVDPLLAATGPSSTRAAVLVFPPGSLFIDGRTTAPAPDPRPGLFALTFLAPAEGSGSITAGILDPRADAILSLAGMVPIEPPTTAVPFSVVPEPGTASLVLAGALAAAVVRRGRR